MPMFITLQEGPEARRQQPDAAVRLRRLQHLAHAGVLGQHAGVAGDGRRLSQSPTCAAAASTAASGTRPARSEHKQNVFDDFIAAAEWLIDEQLHLARRSWRFTGGSNGGLLVGACMTQRPDLFGAALPAVGVMDMLRFHKFTIGWAWVDDYGSSDDPEEFKSLHGLLAAAQHQAGHELPADADHHRRPRRPRGARPQLQVRRRAASRPSRPPRRS